MRLRFVPVIKNYENGPATLSIGCAIGSETLVRREIGSAWDESTGRFGSLEP